MLLGRCVYWNIVKYIVSEKCYKIQRLILWIVKIIFCNIGQLVRKLQNIFSSCFGAETWTQVLHWAASLTI